MAVQETSSVVSPHVHTGTLQFHQMGQEFGILLDMENEARHVPIGALGHEWLAPEAQQRFSPSAHLAVGKNEGGRFAQPAPARFPDFRVAGTGGNFWMYDLFP